MPGARQERGRGPRTPCRGHGGGIRHPIPTEPHRCGARSCSIPKLWVLRVVRFWGDPCWCSPRWQAHRVGEKRG